MTPTLNKARTARLAAAKVGLSRVPAQRPRGSGGVAPFSKEALGGRAMQRQTVRELTQLITKKKSTAV